MSKTPKLYFVDKHSEGAVEPQIEGLRKYFELVPLEEAEVIYCASIQKMPKAILAKATRDIPLVVYCWDYYLWAHNRVKTGGNNWDWAGYAEFLRSADLVLVPSRAQQRRLKELLGVESKVVKSGIPFYEHPTSDQNYILDPARYYPEENRTWAEDAAKELGIPMIHSEHGYTEEEFRKLVANCTFMTCAYREASTGGLTLMEGLYLGKPSLVSNSPYMGAVDYLGDNGYYFQYDDFEDLKSKMKFLWETRPKVDARKYLEAFTYERMSKNICAAVKNLLHE